MNAPNIFYPEGVASEGVESSFAHQIAHFRRDFLKIRECPKLQSCALSFSGLMLFVPRMSFIPTNVLYLGECSLSRRVFSIPTGLRNQARGWCEVPTSGTYGRNIYPKGVA